jgi:hypothetical protein
MKQRAFGMKMMFLTLDRKEEKCRNSYKQQELVDEIVDE